LYGISFAIRYPHLNVVIFDKDEQAQRIANEEIMRHNLQDRIKLKQGDFFTDDIGGNYDLVLLSSLICLLGEKENSFLLERVRKAIRNQGRVVIWDLILDESKTKPASTAIFAVNMLINTQNGRCYSFHEVKKLLKDSGFNDIQKIFLYHSQIIIGRKSDKKKYTRPYQQSSRKGRLSDTEAELDYLLGTATFKMKLNELRLIQKYEKKKQYVKVSIIMPTLNKAFIDRRAIDSVLNQSYRNYELIISDDGSSDDTEKMIKSNYEKDSRIKYIKHKYSGISHARNVALEYSTGDLIAYLDSDNEWLNHYLLLMVNSFLENSNINIMYCGIRIINNVNKEYYIRLQEYERESLLVRNYIDLNIFMHKRSLFKLLGGFNEKLPLLEDWELIIRYTKDSPPFVLQCCLANYYLERDFLHQTTTKCAEETYRRIRRLHNE
jgi:hypothetical protein